MNSSSAALAPIISTDGLFLSILPGSFFIAGTLTALPASRVTLLQNSTNYVSLNTTSGTLEVNQTGFATSGSYPIAVVVTGVSGIQSMTDSRPDLFFVASSSPGGDDTELQFNDGGNLGGIEQSSWDKTSQNLDIFTTIEQGSVNLGCQDSEGALVELTLLANSAVHNTSVGMTYLSADETVSSTISCTEGHARVESTSTINISCLKPGAISIGTASDTIGFFGAAGTTLPTITGSRGGNVALASLLTALAGLGLIVDDSTA